MIENIKSSVFNDIDFVITYFIVLYLKINIYFVGALMNFLLYMYLNFLYDMI